MRRGSAYVRCVCERDVCVREGEKVGKREIQERETEKGRGREGDKETEADRQSDGGALRGLGAHPSGVCLREREREREREKERER